MTVCAFWVPKQDLIFPGPQTPNEIVHEDLMIQIQIEPFARMFEV